MIAELPLTPWRIVADVALGTFCFAAPIRVGYQGTTES